MPERLDFVSAMGGIGLRRVFFILTALLLAGCETGNGWVPGFDGAPAPRETANANVQAPPPPMRRSVSTGQPTEAIVEHCRNVANQRASDARANGYSLEMERFILDGTYKDCMAWDNQHGE